jgi:hypothetical protein
MSAKSATAMQPPTKTEEPKQPPAVSLPETQTTTALALVTQSITELNRVALEVAALEPKYLGVVFDVKTTAGMKAACEARLAIRKPRYTIQKMQKDAKTPLNALKKGIDDQVDAVIARITAIEDPIHEQISNEERRKEDEKRAREEAERQRVAAIRGRIEDDIRAVPLAAVGRSARDIEIFIADIESMVIDHTFAEFQKEAEGAKATTLIRLRAAHTKALAMEAEQKRLAEERAELEKQRAAAAEADRIAREAREKADAEQRAAAELHNNRMSEIHGIQHQVMIASVGRLGVRKGGTIECIRETLAETGRWPIEESNFGPLTGVAQAAKDAALKSIRELLAAAEAKAIQEAEAAAERQRIADENAALQARIDAQKAEEARLEARRQEEANQRAAVEAAQQAEAQCIADERAQLNRRQEEFQQMRAAIVAPPAGEVLGFLSDASPALEILRTGPAVDEPTLMSIRLTEYLPMESVCKAAKEWAVFQDPDSKADQKTDRKLAARAREAVNNLLIAVEQLL